MDPRASRMVIVSGAIMVQDPVGRGIFDRDRYRSAYPEGIGDHFWNRARNRIIADRLRKAGVASARLLEIGCGPGIVVEHLRNAGFDCWGCEAGRPSIAERLRERIFVGQSCLELPAEFRRGVEGILLLDVLEHLPEPLEFLRELRRRFPRSRLLAVTVPSRQELWSHYDEHYGHYRRYDRPSLAALINESGYRVDEVRYLFRTLYLPAYALVLIGRERAVEVRRPSYPKMHHILAELIRWEARLLPAWVPGTSSLAIASVA